MNKKEYHKVLSNFYNRNKIVNVIRPKYINDIVALDFIDNYLLNKWYDTKCNGSHIFYWDKDYDWVFVYSKERENFAMRNHKCWLILRQKYGANYFEIRDLLDDIIKQVLDVQYGVW